MKINITGNNLELTPALKEYIENHLGTLSKLLGKYDADAVQAHIVVARTTKHHSHGDVYQAEIYLTIPKKSIAVKADAGDARIAIDVSVDKLKHEIVKHKEQTLGH